MLQKKFIIYPETKPYGNGDFTIISFAIKAIMTKYPSIFTKIRSFGNTIAFTQKTKGLWALVLPKRALFIASFCDPHIFVLCIYATFYKIPHQTSVLYFFRFLLIFYKKMHFNFISIISFSLDKIKMKWYNQSTFVMEVFP